MKYRYANPLVDAKLFNGRTDCGEAIAKWANSFPDIHASFVPTQEPYDDGKMGCPFSPAHVMAAGPKNSVSVTAGNYLIIFPDGDLGMLRASAFHKEYVPHDDAGILILPKELNFSAKNLSVEEVTKKLREEVARPAFLMHSEVTRAARHVPFTGGFEEAREHGLLPEEEPESLTPGDVEGSVERLPGDDPNPTGALMSHWPFPVPEVHYEDNKVEPTAHVHHSELVDYLHGGPDEAPSAKPAELEGEDDA